MKALIAASLLFSPIALAAPDNASDGFMQLGGGIQSFIGLFYIASFIVGAWLIFTIIAALADFERFKQRADNPSRQIICRALIATVLMNPSTAVMVTSQSVGFDVNPADEFCFAYTITPNKSNNGVVTDGRERECYKKAMTNVQKLLKDKYDQLNEDELMAFLKGKFMVVVGVFQVIAMYFYLNAWFTIYAISEGTERQSTYGKQVVILLFSTIFLNLPTAIEHVLNYLYSLNLT